MAGKASLILVAGFAVIMMYIITNLTSLGTRAVENMSWYNSATASKNLASIGTNAGLAWLRLNPADRGQLFSPQTINNGAYSGGSFTVTATNVGTDLVRLQTISEFPMSMFQTLRDTVDVFLRPEGQNEYRMFSWIANVPGNAQFFYGGDEIWGPIHQNGGIHMGNIPQGTQVPIFHGRVTASQNIQPVGGDRAAFLGGYQTGADQINVPTSFNELIIAANEDGGKTYTEDIYIEINGTEVSVWFSSTEITDPSVAPDEQFMLEDFNGAIYTTGNVAVKGVLDGKVTIGAGQDVLIVDNIVYQTDPAYSEVPFLDENGNAVYNAQYDLYRNTHISHGEDLLGLYAGNDIVIAAKNQDFEVHGILLALNELRGENVQGMNGLYNLSTWGSIIMRGRGDMRFSQGTNHKGFRQKYRYDVRLEDDGFRPLYFPGTITTSFQIVSWYESIQLPPF
jgi:hypothetical protein